MTTQDKRASLRRSTYTKEELLNRERLISIMDNEVSAAEVDIKSGVDTVLAKTRRLIAALPRRLRVKRGSDGQDIISGRG